MHHEAIDVVNADSSPIAVTFEPWGKSRQVAARSSIRVEVASDLPGVIEVVATPGRTLVYAWPGSTLKVYDGGALIGDFTSPVPRLPDGKSSRQFFGSDGPQPRRVALSTLEYRRWFLAQFVSTMTLGPAFAALFGHWFDGRNSELSIIEILRKCGLGFLVAGIIAAVVDCVAIRLKRRAAGKTLSDT